MGRRLKEGDFISFKKQNSEIVVPATNRKVDCSHSIALIYKMPEILQVMKGREFEILNEGAQEILLNQEFMLLPKSDRMGYRLSGIPAEVSRDFEMVSTGVRRGTVQRLPSGQLIVLMADHQTTGGYPRVLEIISADFPKMAQLKQGDKIRFELVGIEDAEEQYFLQRKLLEKLKWAYRFYWNNL